MKSKNSYIVILFYKFTHIANPKGLLRFHKRKCEELGLKGRMIIAKEGINATFEGTRKNIELYKDFLRNDPLFYDVLVKESISNGKAFTKLSIRVRDEVVTLGVGELNIRKETAIELSADDLEKWYKNNDDFVVLDLRNDYEIRCGKMDKTIDPGLSNFRDLPKKMSKLEKLKNKKVLTVCTGGIRCEKATCLLRKKGFSNIYQLKDGLHTYIQKYPGRHFKGTLFVFDNRMTTDVVKTKNKTVIGRCMYCNIATENYCSDDTTRPSKKVLCCNPCFTNHSNNLRRCNNE